MTKTSTDAQIVGSVSFINGDAQQFTDAKEYLDCYERISGSLHDYGIKLLQKQFDLDDECIYELEGYMDFARYGQESAKCAGFVQTEFGQVRRIAQSLEQAHSNEMTL